MVTLLPAGVVMGNRYSTHDAMEAMYQPGSRGRVLANRLGMTRVRDIQHAESEALVSLAEALVVELTENHRFTETDLCGFHRRWLSGIYAWAGNYRQVNMAKGGFHFAAAHLVPELMTAFSRDILAQETPCHGMDVERLVSALARTHAELILVHPFREGNGRLTRLLNTLMAFQAGLPGLDYGGIRGKTKRLYIAAIHAAMGHDYGPMEQVFRLVIKRSLRGVQA